MLGLDAQKMAENIAAGGDTASHAFMATLTALAGIRSELDRNAAGVNLFGTQWEDVREKVILAMTEGQKGLQGFEGATERAAETLENTLGVKLSKIGRQFLGAFADAGQPAIGMLNGLADKVLEKMPLIRGGIKTTFKEVGDFFVLIKDTFRSAKTGVSDAVEFIKGKIDGFTQTLEDHQTTIKVTATILTGIFGPALLITGTRAVIAGAQIAGEFAVSMVKAGVEAVIAGAKITGSFILSLIRTSIQAAITATTVGVLLVGSLVAYAAAGWKTVIAISAQTLAWVAQKAALITSTAVTWAMTAAQWALNSAFWANPMTWVVAGILALIAAGVYLYTHWDELKKKAEKIWTSLRQSAAKFFDPMVTWIDNVIAKFSYMVSVIKNTKIGLPKFLGGNGVIQIPGNATGTDYWQGGLTMVGEKGPEIVNLPRGSQILSNKKTQSILSSTSRKGESVSKRVNIDKIIGKVIVQNEADENRLVAKLKRMIKKELEEELNTSGGGVYAF
jgi:hypothetical protein